jgi:hypothetical protein
MGENIVSPLDPGMTIVYVDVIDRKGGSPMGKTVVIYGKAG